MVDGEGRQVRRRRQPAGVDERDLAVGRRAVEGLAQELDHPRESVHEDRHELWRLLKHVTVVGRVDVDVRHELPVARAAAVVDVAKQKVEHLSDERVSPFDVPVLVEQAEPLSKLLVRQGPLLAGHLQQRPARGIRTAVPQQICGEGDEAEGLVRGKLGLVVSALPRVKDQDDARAGAALIGEGEVRYEAEDELRARGRRHEVIVPAGRREDA
mmetsp:Transcript_21695/g.67949  ORF Transcript_21695/g.67949 Transcript_21695/m.67949 type:complete len:213 (+) Transcript_21695:454-1092(+)